MLWKKYRFWTGAGLYVVGMQLLRCHVAVGHALLQVHCHKIRDRSQEPRTHNKDAGTERGPAEQHNPGRYHAEPGTEACAVNRFFMLNRSIGVHMVLPIAELQACPGSSRHTCCRSVATCRSRVLMYSFAGMDWGPAAWLQRSTCPCTHTLANESQPRRPILFLCCKKEQVC